MLGHILHALQEPCVYLPKADDFRRAKEQQIETYATRDLSKLYDFFSCETKHGHVPMKVIVNVRNDQGDVIAQFKHLPSDAPMFFWNFTY